MFKIFASVQEARFRILMYHRFVEQRRNTTPASVKAKIVVLPLREGHMRQTFRKKTHI